MTKKIYYLLIAVILITLTFTVGERYIDLVVNTLLPNINDDNTTKALNLSKKQQVKSAAQLHMPDVNQPHQDIDSFQINRPSSVEPPNVQCKRPEKLVLTNQYFQLNTNLNTKSDSFTLELKKKLNTAFQHIERSLNTELNQTVLLTMLFSSTRADYEDLARKYRREPEGTQGMYISYHNVSLIDVKNYEQGIKVGVHEAIHALNYTYFGYTLRFINEGMAEYYQAISENGDIQLFDFTWLKHRQYPEQISTILFSKTDWHGVKTHELYQQSKALFYFLMSNESGRQVLRAILTKEMEDPCTVLSEDDIEQLLFEVYPNHQQEFDYWFEDGLNNFINTKA
jgi:hypothetical protein